VYNNTMTISAIRARFRWVYFLPLLHLAVCLAILLGYAIPKLEPLTDETEFLTAADIPISLPAVGLAMGNRVVPALAWLFIAGTLWWYLLSLGAQFIFNRFKRRTHPN